MTEALESVSKSSLWRLSWALFLAIDFVLVSSCQKDFGLLTTVALLHRVSWGKPVRTKEAGMGLHFAYCSTVKCLERHCGSNNSCHRFVADTPG